MSTGDIDFQHRKHHGEHHRADDHPSGAAASATGPDNAAEAV